MASCNTSKSERGGSTNRTEELYSLFVVGAKVYSNWFSQSRPINERLPYTFVTNFHRNGYEPQQIKGFLIEVHVFLRARKGLCEDQLTFENMFYIRVSKYRDGGS